jgi:hypothetical protein
MIYYTKELANLQELGYFEAEIQAKEIALALFTVKQILSYQDCIFGIFQIKFAMFLYAWDMQVWKLNYKLNLQ